MRITIQRRPGEDAVAVRTTEGSSDRIGNCRKHVRRHVWQCPKCREAAGKAPLDMTLDQARAWHARRSGPPVAAPCPFCETCGGLVDEPRESGHGCHCGMTNRERKRLGLSRIPSTVGDDSFVQHELLHGEGDCPVVEG